MSDQTVDSTKLMDIVFTISGGVYGLVQDKVKGIYDSGILQGKMPKGAIVAGVAFDIANDTIKFTVAVASGDPREAAKALVGAVGGGTSTYIGGAIGASAPLPAQGKVAAVLIGMGLGSIGGDYFTEFVFDNYIWPKGDQSPTEVAGGGVSLGVNIANAPSSVATGLVKVPVNSTNRDSSKYINDAGINDHLVIIKSGGTVWDAYVLQKGNPNGFANWDDFKAAVATSNPNIADLNKINVGTKLYMPEQMPDGSITYNYANGSSINQNDKTGEYYMVVPRTDGVGGQMIYSRTKSGVDDDGTPIYTVKQLGTTRDGVEDINYVGSQKGLDGEVRSTNLNYQTDTETGSSSWGREGAREVRTDAVTDKATNETKVKATDVTTGDSKELVVKPQKGMSEADYNNLMCSSMASFLTALRSKDELGIALNGAKMLVDTALYNNDGSIPKNVLNGANLSIAGLQATVGIVAGLHALQSNDLKTQISGAVGLLGSANTLYRVLNANANGTLGKSYFSEGTLGVLATYGAVMSIANLQNLDSMLQSGQIGSAISTIYQAWQGASALYGAATGAGSFFAAMGNAAAATGPYVLAVVVAGFVLDSMLGGGKKPPPQPPVGWAEYVRNAQGQLQYLYHGATADGQDLPGDKGMGDRILQTKMTEILDSLNKQLADANNPKDADGKPIATDPDRALVVVASRLPKLYLQSWPSYDGNGETNYYYYAEMTHAQTGQKYGADDAKWQTKGRWVNSQSRNSANDRQWKQAQAA